MFLVQERTPGPQPFTDTNTALIRGKERYWDGAYAGVRLLPKPDSVERFDVECLDISGGRLHDEDYIRIGPNDEVMQLIRLYLAGVARLQEFNSTDFHKSLIAFRKQQAG